MQQEERKTMEVGLSTKNLVRLASLAKKRNNSPAQVISQAIQTEEFLQNEIERGSKIFIHRPDGTLREIILRE